MPIKKLLGTSTLKKLNGKPTPLGVTQTDKKINFALFLGERNSGVRSFGLIKL